MVPELHPQWRGLDLADLLSKGAAFVNMDAQNSILSPDGVLRHENLWRGAREPGGSFHNILRLAAACRTLAMPFIWLRYDRFVGAREPKSALDVCSIAPGTTTTRAMPRGRFGSPTWSRRSRRS